MRKKKIRLGKKTNQGYKYASGIINLDEKLEDQIEKFLEEEEIIESLERKIDNLQKIINSFEDKKTNIDYYYLLGKKLQFIDRQPFSEVKPWSLFRLIYELLPKALPHISISEMGSKHIAMMFYLGKIDERDIPKATWDQWREIVKFKDLFTDRRLYKKVLLLIKGQKVSGPQLRKAISKKIKKWRKLPP